MMVRSFFVLCVLAGVAQAEEPPAAALRAYLDAEWERELVEDPIEATYAGDHRYDRELPNLSFAAVDKQHLAQKDALERLVRIPRDGLTPADQLTYDVYKWVLERRIDRMRFCHECMPLNQLDGPQKILAELVEVAPPTTIRQAEDLLVRMEKFPTFLDQHIAWMKRGIEKRIVPPRVLLEKVPPLLAAQLPAEPQKSPLYVGFQKLPESIALAERQRLQARALAVITQKVQPAQQRFADFVKKTYLPAARTTIGLSALPDGAAWYDAEVRAYTTLPAGADELHQIGLAEVARLRAEMERVKQETGFAGSLAQFFDFLRTDPRFFYTDKDDLLRGYRDICKRIDGELPRLFGTLPRLPYGVVAIPAYAEATQTTAYYVAGSPSDGRAGRYYANTYDLKSRPTWEMEALTLHESVPGHHLQIALAQEMENVPRFRQNLYIEAFGEGWGLYAESLGKDLGLYQSPYSRFGQLVYEMWRAVRLVVDTGMHQKGWSRAQAIAYFRDNTGKSEHDITVEVDRYLAWPGQALAYKSGERKLKELRARAQTLLGARFDLRRFHDLVLEAGPLPLPLLEARVMHQLTEETKR